MHKPSLLSNYTLVLSKYYLNKDISFILLGCRLKMAFDILNSIGLNFIEKYCRNANYTLKIDTLLKKHDNYPL